MQLPDGMSLIEALSGLWGGICCTATTKDEELSELVTVRQGMKRFIQALVQRAALESARDEDWRGGT